MQPFRSPVAHITFIVTLFAACVPPARGADARWIYGTGGFWHLSSNWLSNALPVSSTGVTYVTNAADAGAQTITLDAATPSANRTIRQLNLGAPAGSTNTLLVTGLGAAVFQLRNSLNVTSNGILIVTNSTMELDASTLGSFNIDTGTGFFEGGTLRIFDNSLTGTNAMFRVGRNGRGSVTMNGGALSCHDIEIGDLPGAFGIFIINGGDVVLSNLFTIADNTNSTGQVFLNSGTITTTNDIRVGDDGNGLLHVTAGLVAADSISVGHDNKASGLLVLQGGVITNKSTFSVGRLPGSTGEVLIAGGLLHSPTGHVHVGRASLGRLTVSNGTVFTRSLTVSDPTNSARGTLTLAGEPTTVTNSFEVGSAAAGLLASTGAVSVVGGLLDVTNELFDARLAVSNGTFTLSGGSVNIDVLRLTNSGGKFAFNSGALFVYDALVSNGLPFVVGDGVHPAVLHLRGGTNYFPDGLVINTNALLTGCGVIVGPITNSGTIATNCSGPQAPTILAQPASVSVPAGTNVALNVIATGDPALLYQWSFNGTNLAGAIFPTLNLNNVSAADAGTYSVIVSNAAGSAPSSNALVRVLVEAIILSITANLADAEVSLQSTPALDYTIEYKNDLQTNLTWLFLTNTVGTGGVITINDPTVPGAKRFYRVVVY